MAQSYDRRINLYINVDGKEIQNNVKSIRGELNHLINAQNKMTIGSKEYNEQTAKIKQLKAVLNEHSAAIKSTESPMQKLIGTAKGLLPAFGFAALGGLAQQAFSKIISATDTLGTRWAVFIGGLTSGLNEFWRTAAAGDWSNFLTNFREAVKVGRQYEQMLDQIEEKTRSLRVQEAESRAEELRLEDMLRNKTLSEAERIKAGQDRIALEENLAKQRVKVAQDAFDAELAVTMQQTRLSKERLMSVVRDMDSETKAKAQAYNEQYQIFEEARKKNEQVQAGLSRGGVTTNPFADQMDKAKAVLDSYPDSVKTYAEALRSVGITTDKQLNKMVSSYEGLLTAQNSAMENTRRVRTQVNSLLAGEEGGKVVDTILKQLDKANNERTAKLIAQFEKEKWTDERFKEESLAAEIAYLTLKKEILAKYGESTIEIEAQINSKRLEAIKLNNNQALEELKRLQAQIEELQKKDIAGFETSNKADYSQLEESITATAKSIEESTQTIDKAKENEKQILEERQNAYLSFALMVGGSLGDLMNDSEATFADYLKNILAMSLEALHQFFLLKKAEVLIDSAAGAATGRFWKIAGAVAAVIAMEAAYQGIKGALTSKKSDKTAKHAAGGYAYEEQYIVSEENKPEWIAPNWMLKNPVAAPMIANLEQMRRTRYTVRPEALAAASQFSSPAQQVYTKGTTAAPSFSVATSSAATDDIKQVLQENTKAIRDLMSWEPSISIETYERKRKNYEKITSGGIK